MKNTKILVLGATGKTGRRVAERLSQINGIEVRRGSRNGNPAFDWEEPTTWNEALSGIDTAYVTFQPDLAVPSAPGLIREFTKLATQKGVSKIVLLSGRGEEEAQACEEIVKENAKTFAIIRASWFNQNFSESIFLEPILSGHVALPQSEVLEPFVDADDIADVAVAALLDEAHNGKTYELTGPRLLTLKQAVAEIAEATGREIVFQSLSVEEYTNTLRNYQVPEDFIWLVDYLFSHVLDGRNAFTTDDIERVLGRKAKDFKEYAVQAAETGIWNYAPV